MKQSNLAAGEEREGLGEGEIIRNSIFYTMHCMYLQ